MKVLDASIALKWFVGSEPLANEARAILDDIESDPRPYVVPELFMNELLAVLSRLPGMTTGQLREALSLVESLGLARIANGHELLATAAAFAVEWRVSGYDATYLALATLTDGVWLTADERAAKRVPRKGLVRLLSR